MLVPSRRTDRLTKLSERKGRLILCTRKVVEAAENPKLKGGKGGEWVKAPPADR